MLDVSAIQQEIDNGYIVARRHPDAPLTILNYTVRTQVEWHWNAATMQCRGLIVDDSWNVVARPFKKFFSYEQLGGVVPHEPFEVLEKLDGSLGILYFWNGQPYIASRGSFDSEQARFANGLLRTKYREAEFDPRYTYLFEVIYPENRIIVDYGDREELVLLAIVETATGAEKPLPRTDTVFPVAARYDGLTRFDDILAMQQPGKEGFVVLFDSGLRVKVKFAEYLQLNRLLSGVREKVVWERLRAGATVDDVVRNVPDEFFDKVRAIAAELIAKYNAIESRAFEQLPRSYASRKEFAEYAAQCEYPAVMFAMLDDDYVDLIWRMIRPTTEYGSR